MSEWVKAVNSIVDLDQMATDCRTRPWRFLVRRLPLMVAVEELLFRAIPFYALGPWLPFWLIVGIVVLLDAGTHGWNLKAGHRLSRLALSYFAVQAIRAGFFVVAFWAGGFWLSTALHYVWNLVAFLPLVLTRPTLTVAVRDGPPLLMASDPASLVSPEDCDFCECVYCHGHPESYFATEEAPVDGR